MKILFIATANPFIRSGGGMANYAYLKAISAVFPNQVDLALPSEEIPKNSDYNYVAIRTRTWVEKCLGIFKGSIHRYKESVSEILANNKYDLCVINGGHYAGDMIDMLHYHGCKVMVFNHNFEREFQTTAYSNPVMRYYYVKNTIKNENRSYKKAEVNCFITEEDYRLFTSVYGETNSACYVVGVFDPFPETFKDYQNKYKTFTAVISGSVNADQTVDGIRDFHDNYWELLKAIVPDCKLIFTGRNADRLYSIFPDFRDEHIEIIPNPVDINEIVSRAHIYICPINVGGGLKLRVMDGLKMGLPILTHKVSARGYEPFVDKDYFAVYKDKDSFEKGIRKLIEIVHDGVKEDLIKSDYSTIFGTQSGIDRFKSLIEKITSKHLL